VKRYIIVGAAMVVFVLLGGSAVVRLLSRPALEWLTWAAMSMGIVVVVICWKGLVECIQDLRRHQ
jgi:hypothetical protein